MISITLYSNHLYRALSSYELRSECGVQQYNRYMSIIMKNGKCYMDSVLNRNYHASWLIGLNSVKIS